MTIKRYLLVAFAALAAIIAVSGIVAHASAASSDQDAVQAAAVRDATVSVAPWIPCSNGHAAVLSAAAVQTQRGHMADLFRQTYASNESTHGAMLGHLQDLVGRYGPGGKAVASGDTLCEPSGGVDHVQVVAFTSSGSTATITIQFHAWNETIGTHNGVPFHYRPQNDVQITDEAVKVGGQWLIAQRGAPMFLNGQSG